MGLYVGNVASTSVPLLMYWNTSGMSIALKLKRQGNQFSMLSMDFSFSNLNNIQVSSVQSVVTYHHLGSAVVNFHIHYVKNESIKGSL